MCEEVAPSRIDSFFSKHKQHFAPESVYRAKTLALFEKRYQLEFVDVGLMPLVESDIGRSLSQLIERGVYKLRGTLYPRQVSQQAGHWLFKSVFWLVAAKVLQDKGVRAFSSLQLADVDEVYARLAEHYRAKPVLVQDGKRRAALAAIAHEIEDFAHLGHVTTESLSYVYENTLISKETRSALGTHSTPSYLVDYMVWQLTDWIEEIPCERRHVFEPACGHGAFLVSAMRLLREMLPSTISDARARHDYFKKRLHGLDTDAFAVEIARLSLTLADIPNPNGWDVQVGDMFDDNALSDHSAKAMILLANPPFERFTDVEKAQYSNLRQSNKASEMLARMLPHLKPGAVFGIVVPQGFLHSNNATPLRRLLCNDFEVQEICLFPDNIFVFSDMESAIIMGRRRAPKAVAPGLVRYRRVREPQSQRFRERYTVTTDQTVDQRRFITGPDCDMRIPDLEQIWDWCKGMDTLHDVAHSGKGFDFFNKDTLRARGLRAFAQQTFPGSAPGFLRLEPKLMIHELPADVQINLSPEVIKTPRAGTVVEQPQVLVNYAPVSRGPWRIKAFIDRQGHAITSRFVAVRSRLAELPLEFLWAMCNSPLANAYVYAHTMKRDILVGVLRRMPVPRLTEADVARVTAVACNYLDAVRLPSQGLRQEANPTLLRNLLLQMDAEVLRLYQLPPRYERQLLNLFSGWQREGVPCRFDRYFPEDYEPCFSLHEYLSDEYRRSTAGELLERYEPIKSPGLRRALDAAVEAFRE
ncbi:MAG: N-6 DNA methylase [Phycisphaerae bacterium]|nr:N-6 DNA methylase [Phycisphaerae bacterium]